MAIPRFEVQRVPDCEPDIGLWLAILDSARQGTQIVIKELTLSQLDAKPVVGINTIGTLLYHLALADLHWVYTNMLQRPYPEQITHLFPYSMTDETGRLSVVSGWDIEDYQERLLASRVKVREVFRSMSIEAFRNILKRIQAFGAYEMTPEAVIRHLTLHETEHIGEIKILLGALH